MELIVAAVIIAISLMVSQKLRLSYAIKPRKALAQLTVIGPTERGEETFQIVGTLFEDESLEDMDAKIKLLTEIRERRVAFCNARMTAVLAEAEATNEAAQKALKDSGLEVVQS